MIKIICFGKIKEKYLEQLIDDYKNRISKYHKIEIIELKDCDVQSKETKQLLNVIKKADYNILLDIKGEAYDSEQFAKHLDKLFLYNGVITFIIGSSVGVSDDIKSICDEKISFSNFTMPHGLFRGVLLEQIYRSFKINNNENYHK